jgi:4-diphosphocytidyl-2-C-methyl-D-erythritol kinase
MGASAALTLWKALPVASGIGGGSADAAATLRAVARLTGQALPDPVGVLALGADVPVCLWGRPVRMQGVGEVLTPLPALPPLWMVLANPRVPVATPRVFAALTSRDNPSVPALPADALRSADAFATWLARETRNDLAAPARQLAPVLADVEAALAAMPGCLLARMSGSGATHFGLFAGPDQAGAAARHLAASHPDWWIAEAPVLPAASAPDGQQG